MSTKEQIKAAAAKRFKTKEIDLGDGVTLTLRELSKSEMKTLDARLYECDSAGEVVLKDGRPTPLANVHFDEEWIAATAEPKHTVEDLLDESWPTSLKDMLCREAMRVNGFTIKDAVGN